MTQTALQAYCFSKVFEPEPAKVMQFDRHYLLYSARGAIRLEAEDRNWVLPPSRAAWIPADTEIRIEITHEVDCCSVLYHKDFVDSPVTSCQVLTLSPIAREMILHTRRWGPELPALDDHALSFFRTLAGTCAELAATPSEVWTPRGKSRAMQKALAFTQDHLATDCTFADVAKAAGQSTRSLARSFASEAGMTWRQMQRRMRMIRALELLSNVEDRVLNVAFDVGYNSQSSFNRAFREFSGYSPGEFRARYYSSDPGPGA
ncbi:MAG: helix-turn-helix transcriptional regulator [Alphaproteobacteria bacterium]|jgi:AraC-like DNA-binding protein|nr:helix-turn-helix transcriptional regulator [Alphaproteobacteria bacterium]MBT4084565.1 helix-turn-helix transcriptional regulator [Alphaproteobacteria bacterium]MBT4544612.1 helix-turn-helix transcriptional regulator [Alphaproteobacteria bacterium]MBT7745743.1 helix-turn-helix transcriptional regulator [Alphaproteobacteria bacterium]